MLASKRCSGSATSVRATQAMFQMLNWPSASVPSVRPRCPRPRGERPGHQDRERQAGRLKRGGARAGARWCRAGPPCRIARHCSAGHLVTSRRAAGRRVDRAGRVRVVRRDRLHRRLDGAAAGARLGVLPLDAAHLAIAVLAGLVVLAIGLRGAAARAPVAIAVAPLVLVFLPWLPFPRARGLPHLDRRARVARLDRGRRSRSSRVARARPWHLRRSSAPAMAGAPAGRRSRSSSFRSPPFTRRRRFPAATSRTTSSSRRACSTTAISRSRTTTSAATIAPTSAAICRRTSSGAAATARCTRSTRPGCRRSSLPAFAIGGYHGVVVFLILVSSAACALAWWLAWRVDRQPSAAWFGWAAVTLSAPFLLESYTVFPDAPGAAIVLTGFWALLRADEDRRRTRNRGPTGRRAIVAALAAGTGRRSRCCRGCTRDSRCSRRRSAA